MITYCEDEGCGKVTASTAQRLRQQLTWKGLEVYWANLKAGMTPRQAVHKIIVEERQRAKERSEQARRDFIAYGSPIAQMSIPEFIASCGRECERRWNQANPLTMKRLLKNWQAKDVPGAVANYVNQQLKLASEGQDFSFRFLHVDRIRESIEYGLEYNQEAYQTYLTANLI